MDRVEIRITGLGGQGVVLAGQILARAAVYSGRNAVQIQSYGAEARGSAAKSEILISSGKIGFPAVRECDILVAMGQAALDAYFGDLKKGGVLIVDSDLVKSIPQKDVHIYRFSFTQTAKTRFGAAIFANMMMLGVLVKLQGVVDVKNMLESIKEGVPSKTVKENLKAFRAGLQLSPQ